MQESGQSPSFVSYPGGLKPRIETILTTKQHNIDTGEMLKWLKKEPSVH